MKEKYKIVIVKWDDSRQPQGHWRELSSFNDLDVAKCISVGFLIRKNKKVTVLAQNIADLNEEDMQGAGIIQIPTAAITKITTLAK